MRQVCKLLIALSVMLALLFSVACATEEADTGEMAEETEAKTEMVEAPAMTSRLDTVRERGHVICASRNDVPGYGSVDADGNNVGFDIDLCRAVAAAVLGDPDAFEIRLITAAERGPTIQSGEVDLLVRTVTWTTSRDAAWGNYAQTMFYDGQGFMVPKSLGVTSALELAGAAVCVTSGTTTELNMADFFRQNNLEYNPKVYEDTDVVLEAYKSGACEVFTNDRSQLAALRTALPNPDDHVILPETISEEPLGPVVPHGDEQWFDLVKTVMGLLIYAEAYGINSTNVDDMAVGENVKAKRLLGTEGSFGQEELGLDQNVGQTIIKAVGNYGEIYARNLDNPDGVQLPREGSRNALWSNAPCTDCPKGGQIYSQPLR
ncbi:MAG: amino acid ABC transporter substrate-binding protein [Chloroflexi bacterium]|nr:amino acid ABC transporter substrate-binding protein [Chloroflexota bacterium]